MSLQCILAQNRPVEHSLYSNLPSTKVSLSVILVSLCSIFILLNNQLVQCTPSWVKAGLPLVETELITGYGKSLANQRACYK